MTKKRKNKGTFHYHLIPILAILCLLPLIVYAKVMAFDTSTLSWYSEDLTYLIDIFNYYKSTLVLMTSSIMFIILMKKIWLDHLSINHKLFSPVYAYALCVILSTLFSTSINFSSKGYINHLENVWVLLAYLVIFIYTATVIDNHQSLETMTFAWIVSITLLSLIGLTQFLGIDLYRSTVGLSLIIPPGLKDQISNVDFTLWRDNLIYQSLFHSNYVSFYSAMAFPYFLTLSSSEKDLKKKLLYFAVMIVLILNLFGSQARNGLVGVALGTLIVLIFFGRKLLLNKYVLLFIGLLIIATTTIITNTDTIIEQRTLAAFTGFNQPIDYPLNAITTEDDTIIVDHDQLYLNVKLAESNQQLDYTFSDKNGHLIPTNVSDNTINFLATDSDSNDYTKLKASLKKYQTDQVLQLTLVGSEWNFLLQDGQAVFLNVTAKTESLVSAPYIGFEGIERWGSQRGYIWSRTLPLILDRPLLGYGPDTFAAAFPQNDYAMKLNAYGNEYTIVDKPHNILLNYAVHTGIPSLLAILTIIAISYYRTFRRFIFAPSSLYKTYAIASLSAITGYVGAGMFNDTSLQITPLFWVIIGINYAVCGRSKQAIKH